MFEIIDLFLVIILIMVIVFDTKYRKLKRENEKLKKKDEVELL